MKCTFLSSPKPEEEERGVRELMIGGVQGKWVCVCVCVWSRGVDLIKGQHINNINVKLLTSTMVQAFDAPLCLCVCVCVYSLYI